MFHNIFMFLFIYRIVTINMCWFTLCATTIGQPSELVNYHYWQLTCNLLKQSILTKKLWSLMLFIVS